MLLPQPVLTLILQESPLESLSIARQPEEGFRPFPLQRILLLSCCSVLTAATTSPVTLDSLNVREA